jgi:hypothetical protein
MDFHRSELYRICKAGNLSGARQLFSSSFFVTNADARNGGTDVAVLKNQFADNRRVSARR